MDSNEALAMMNPVEYAFNEAVLSYIGVPYEFGGQSLDGLDCSGLIMVVLKDLGFPLRDMTADDLARKIFTLPYKQYGSPNIGVFVNYDPKENVYDHIGVKYANHVVHSTDYEPFVKLNRGATGVMVTKVQAYYNHMSGLRVIRTHYLDFAVLVTSLDAMRRHHATKPKE